MATPAQKIQLGLKGLNQDLPPYTLPTDYFNDGLNIRVKDGSLQAVPQASEFKINGVSQLPVNDADTPTEVNVVSMEKYIPDGNDYINMVLVGVDINGVGKVRFSTNRLSDNAPIPGVTEIAIPDYLSFKYDHEYHVDNFIFNSIGIVNGKTNQPMYFNANLNNSSALSMNPLPNWIHTTRVLVPEQTVSLVTFSAANGTTTVTFTGTGSIATYITAGDKVARNDGSFSNASFTGSITGSTLTVSAASNVTLGVGDTVTGFGVLDSTVITAQLTATTYTVSRIQTVPAISMTSTSTDYIALSVGGSTVTFADDVSTAWGAWVGKSVYQASPYISRFMTTFQGRLFALNLKRTQGPNTPEYSPIEFAWSDPLTQLQSLAGINWTASTTNTAGNDYLTESPGEIFCAVPLGEYLVTYKSDQVYKVINSGAPNYYEQQPLYTDDGIISARAVVEINESKHLFVGNNGIWLHQGGIEKQNISRGRIEEAFYRGSDGIDLNYKGSTFCYHNVLEKEVWVCYRSKNAWIAPVAEFDLADVNGCDKAYVYNYMTDTWHKRSLGDLTTNNNVTSNANYITEIQDVLAGATLITLAAAPAANFRAQEVPNGLYYFPHVTPTSVGIFEESGYVQFNSRDIGTAAMVKNIDGIYPHSDEPLYFQIKFSNNIKFQDFDTVVKRRFDPLDSNYRLDFRETGRYLHMKLTLSGANSGDITVANPATNPRLTDFDIIFEQRGRR